MSMVLQTMIWRVPEEKEMGMTKSVGKLFALILAGVIWNSSDADSLERGRLLVGWP